MTILNLGTYPPKQCGIATFSWDLRKSLIPNGHKVDIIAVSDNTYNYSYGNEVKYNISQQIKQDYIRAAAYINSLPDVNMVIIQHEYGIFGGMDGEYILELSSRLEKPYLVITHTVLPQPLPHQRSVLSRLCSSAAAVVCMTKRSAKLLADWYDVPPPLLGVINHGVPEFKKRPQNELKLKYGLNNRQIVSTFGLIGPGKGLELGIKAMSEVVKEFPAAIYLILGQTHPMLQKNEGESYRSMLESLCQELRIEDQVRFINRFLTDEELGEYLYLTDIYLSPYPNKDQAVSGTLSFAMGCGRAIVSTSYAYALEMLSYERGLLAENPDPHRLADLIKLVLADPDLKRSLQKNAYELGKTWSWPNIGRQYSQTIDRILSQEKGRITHVGL